MIHLLERGIKPVFILLLTLALLVFYNEIKQHALYSDQIRPAFSEQEFHRQIQQHTAVYSPAALAKKIDELTAGFHIPQDNLSLRKLRTGRYARLCGFDRNDQYMPVIGDKEHREVALTFDIGNLSAGEQILDTLKQHGIKATFFLANNQSYLTRTNSNGKQEFERTLEHPRFHRLLRRMVNEGHEVGNHTWSHHNWELAIDVGRKKIEVNREHLHRELKLVNDLFRRVTGRNLAPIWRSPFGACNAKIVRWAEEAGYAHIYWTKGMDSLDWTDYKSAQETLSFLKRNVRPGGVYLFHLGNALRVRSDKIYTVLPELITWLKANNYHPVTVTELIDGKRSYPAGPGTPDQNNGKTTLHSS